MMTKRGFTLIELMVSMAIIAMLASLAFPQVERMMDKARSTTCMNNLRQIGLAVTSYKTDHDATFPVIETNPENPVYAPEAGAKGMLETLGSYGVTESLLRCSADVARNNYFKKWGNSYEWRPIVDDENANAPKIYSRRGDGYRIAKPSRVIICTDVDAVHFGRFNRLYADGHVAAQLK